MRRICCCALLLLPLFALPASAATTTLNVTVAAGKYDRSGTPVSQSLTLPAAFADLKVVTLQDQSGKLSAVAQLTGPGLLDDGPEPAKGEVRRELHFILPKLKAGDSLQFKAVLDSEKPEKWYGDAFHWKDHPGESSDLLFGDQPVLRYVCKPFDDSTKEKRYETYKVFHQLWTPDGKELATNGVEDPKRSTRTTAAFFTASAKSPTTAARRPTSGTAPRPIRRTKSSWPPRPARCWDGSASSSPGTAKRRRFSPMRSAN